MLQLIYFDLDKITKRRLMCTLILYSDKGTAKINAVFATKDAFKC